MAKQDGQLMITVDGDLAGGSVGQLKQDVLKAVNEQAQNIAIDMTGVKTVSSLGVILLISIQNTLVESDCSLTLCYVNDELKHMLNLMGLDQHFEVNG